MPQFRPARLTAQPKQATDIRATSIFALSGPANQKLANMNAAA